MCSNHSNQQQHGLSIIVPCYNEEGGITDGIEGLLGVLKDLDAPYEILAVDDGSTDDTLKKIEAFEGRVRLLRNDSNLGYGASLKHGLRKAHYDVIAITDADGTYPPHYLLDLYAKVRDENYDMAVGARTGANVAVPWERKPAKWMLGKIANFVAARHIPDINSGLRVFKRAVAMQMYNLFPDGFSFTTTITLAMITNGFDVHYQPIDYLKRVGHSKIRPIRDTLNFLQLIARISLYFAPLKLFLPLSLSLILLSILWGVFSYVILEQFADVTTLVLFVTGLQLGVLGMLAEMINMRTPRSHEKRVEE